MSSPGSVLPRGCDRWLRLAAATDSKGVAMFGRFGKDAGSLVGVEITPDAVRIMQLQQRNRRWRVMGSAQELSLIHI